MEEIKEALASYELAVLLKEKGFDLDTDDYWINNYTGLPDNKWRLVKAMHAMSSFNAIAVPKLSLIQTWLRVKHGICAYIDWANGFDCVIGDKMGNWCKRFDFHDFTDDPETALDPLLIEATKLIEV